MTASSTPTSLRSCWTLATGLSNSRCASQPTAKVTFTNRRQSCFEGKRKNETVFPKAFWPFFPTVWHVRKFVTDRKLAPAVSLGDRDYQDLLDILVADGKIEAIPIVREGKDAWAEPGGPKVAPKPKKKRKRVPENDDDSDDIDEDDSDDEDESEHEVATVAVEQNGVRSTHIGPPGAGDYVVYRSIAGHIKGAERSLGVMSGLLDGPCGNCPVRDQCDNAGRPRLQPGNGASLAARKWPKGINPLSLVIPSASDLGEALGGDGVWRGGGSKGAGKRGEVNPEDCSYYQEWLSISYNLPAQADLPDYLPSYPPERPYDW